jgi:hypothetical protein
VEFAGDDKEKAVLLLAFFDQMLAGLHGEEFAIPAEDVTVLVAEGFEDALGWKLGCGEGAHGRECVDELSGLF